MQLKSLLFGSAALIAAGTGAQAADLPIAEPVEYVRICDAFGTGFYYIPGTDTCLRISGRVRIESHYVDDWVGDDDNPFIDREFNNWTTRARGNVRLDARTQTDFGLVRAFIEYQLTLGPSDFDRSYSVSPDLVQAFIQVSNDWGTYTAGHTASFFDFWGSNTYGTRVSIDDNTTEQTLFAYTFGFGNGISATLSVEDPQSSGRRKDYDAFLRVDTLPFAGLQFTTLFDPGALDSYEGQEAPDLVANIRIDQGWGSAQIMGVVRQIHDKENFEFDLPPTAVFVPGVGVVILPGFATGAEGAEDGDDIGWAIGGGLSLNLPFAGLVFNSQAGYSEGAIAYITSDPASKGFFGGRSTGDFFGPDGDNQTEAWMVRAGINGQFTPTVGFSLDGSYTEIDSGGRVTVFALPPILITQVEGIDYTHFAVVGNVHWNPVPGLEFGWEAGWEHVEYDNNDVANFLLTNGGNGELDVFGAMFRVQRDF